MREALLAAWRPARGTLAKDGLRGPACRSSRWSGLRAWGGFRPGRRRRAQRGFWPAARRPCPQPPAACASWALAACKGAGSGASAGQAEGCRRACTGPLPGTCALRSLAAGKTGWEGGRCCLRSPPPRRRPGSEAGLGHVERVLAFPGAGSRGALSCGRRWGPGGSRGPEPPGQGQQSAASHAWATRRCGSLQPASARQDGHRSAGPSPRGPSPALPLGS